MKKLIMLLFMIAICCILLTNCKSRTYLAFSKYNIGIINYITPIHGSQSRLLIESDSCKFVVTKLYQSNAIDTYLDQYGYIYKSIDNKIRFGNEYRDAVPRHCYYKIHFKSKTKSLTKFINNR